LTGDRFLENCPNSRKLAKKKTAPKLKKLNQNMTQKMTIFFPKNEENARKCSHLFSFCHRDGKICHQKKAIE